MISHEGHFGVEKARFQVQKLERALFIGDSTGNMGAVILAEEDYARVFNGHVKS